MRALMYRQGDVLVFAASVPEDAKRVIREGRIVLAYGEVTGHAHAIEETCVEQYERGGVTYLRVTGPAEIRHEEHGRIPLPPGDYVVRRQREYTPEAIRDVAD